MKELTYLVLKSFVTLVLFLLIHNFAEAQVVFPHYVVNGDTIIHKSGKKVLKIAAEQDTFWILKNSQYKNALIFAKKYKLSEEQIVEYKNQIELYKQKSSEQDKLVETLTKDRDFYRTQLTDCENDVTEFSKKCKKQKLLSRIAMIAIPVAFGLGILVPL